MTLLVQHQTPTQRLATMLLSSLLCLAPIAQPNGTQQGGGSANNAPATSGLASTTGGATGTQQGQQTTPTTPEQQLSSEAGLGGAVSGTLQVQKAPGNTPGVYVFGHWVDVGSGGTNEKVMFTVGASYVSFTYTLGGSQTSTVVSKNPDGSLHVVHETSSPGGTVFSYTQTVTNSQTITNYADGSQSINILLQGGAASVNILLRPPELNGGRNYDYSYADGKGYKLGEGHLNPGETLDVNAVVNKFNPPTVTIPLGTGTPSTSNPGAPDRNKANASPSNQSQSGNTQTPPYLQVQPQRQINITNVAPTGGAEKSPETLNLNYSQPSLDYGKDSKTTKPNSSGSNVQSGNPAPSNTNTASLPPANLVQIGQSAGLGIVPANGAGQQAGTGGNNAPAASGPASPTGGGNTSGGTAQDTTTTAGENFGTRIQGGPYNVPIYVYNDGKGTQTIQVSVQNAPWLTLTGPTTVTVPAGGQPEAVNAQINTTNLPPGVYTGTIVYKCTNCTDPNSPQTTYTGQVTVRVVPTTISFDGPANPNDSQFLGLVNGQPTDVCTVLQGAINDVSNSSFGQTAAGQAIVSKLRKDYLSNNCAHLKPVATVSNPDKNGKLSPQTQAVDSESPKPGDAEYVLSIGSGPFANLFKNEDIYVGIDLTQEGIDRARQNPGDYYIFTYNGKIGVVPRSELISTLVHEGLHAVQGGNYNVPRPDGKGKASSTEEEQDAFNAGNQAIQALGYPPEGNTAGAGYGRGSNPNYKPLTTTGATQQTGTTAPAPKTAPTTGGAKTQTGTNPPGANGPGNANGTGASGNNNVPAAGGPTSTIGGAEKPKETLNLNYSQPNLNYGKDSKAAKPSDTNNQSSNVTPPNTNTAAPASTNVADSSSGAAATAVENATNKANEAKVSTPPMESGANAGNAKPAPKGALPSGESGNNNSGGDNNGGDNGANNGNAGDNPPPPPNPTPAAEKRPKNFRHAQPATDSTGITEPNQYTVTVCEGTNDYVFRTAGEEVDARNVKSTSHDATGVGFGSGIRISGNHVGSSTVDADFLHFDGTLAAHVKIHVTVIDCGHHAAVVTDNNGPGAKSNPPVITGMGGNANPNPPGKENENPPGGDTGGGFMDVLGGLDEFNNSFFGNAPGAPTVQNIVITININTGGAAPAVAGTTGSLRASPQRTPTVHSHSTARGPARFKLVAYQSGSPSRAPSPERLFSDRVSSKFSSSLPSAEGLAFSIVASGNLGTNALEFRVHDPSGKLKGNVELPEGMVLEPLKVGARNPVNAAGGNNVAQQLTAYCLDMAKLPPEPGQLYRLAPPALQEKYKPIRAILEAGRKLAAAGVLHPDSEANAYADFVRQHALWAQFEHWTEQEFTKVFLERTKKNAEHMNVKWTKEMEDTLRGAAPGRWRDIAMVLDEAHKLRGAARAP